MLARDARGTLILGHWPLPAEVSVQCARVGREGLCKSSMRCARFPVLTQAWRPSPADQIGTSAPFAHARTCIARHPPVPTHIQSNQSGLMGGTLVEDCAAPGPPKSFPGEWKWPPSKDGRI